MKFEDKVYNLVKKIPRCKISTYKIISEKLNSKAYRLVGQVLNKNPYKFIPCHRIVNSNKNIGGFNRGIKIKIKLLKKEGIKIRNNKVLNFERVLYKFK